ncbi:chaperone modulator CbpM [Synechococcus sp. Nb3U1]|uniref:chaperone modulator CbpM n=1 Tax=Synechococcus sp. Nb3U1 TaxID=1914529 RepID=UPI001F28ED88|nr:chaperone modulator CbpM [Synechococcus sp. Nb3U1]MCF2972172.1 chaperone modulator CbpM [Synechococcus sp. Nb3U1]
MSLAIVQLEERFYTLEQTTEATQLPLHLLEWLIGQGLIEMENQYLAPQQVRRLIQMKRLHRDLGLNWTGAAMVLDMAQEIAQLKAQLRVYRGF